MGHWHGLVSETWVAGIQRWLVGWLVGWLVCWLVCWLVGWLDGKFASGKKNDDVLGW